MAWFKERASHFCEIVLKRIWWLVFAIFFSAVSAAITWRDELLPPEIAQKYRVLNMIPHWEWGWWILISATAILLVLVDGSFRIHADLKKKHEGEIDSLKHELDDATGFSDEMRSNIYSKIERLSPEANHALHRVVTAEIEADQLNVDMRGELERAGFIKPAFAYTPAEFIERYRPLIQQWFRERP
jgi:hypothetical protein